MSRLPTPGQDDGQWGSILNDYLSQAHNSDGSLKDGSVTTSTIAGTLPQSKVTNLTTDLASVTTTANNALTTAQQAASGTIADGSVTLTKLAASVQTSLGKADTAAQPADLTAKANATDVYTKTQVDSALATKATDAAALHKAGIETVTGAKDFTGGITVNNDSVVVSTDARLTDQRTPIDGSVTTAKIASGGIAESAVTNLTSDLAAKANAASLATVATSGAYSDLSGKPSLATVATSGSYADLTNKPTLGTAASLSVGTTTGTVAAGDDSRFTNARTPTAHASTHASVGSDPVTIAQSQVTGLVTDLKAASSVITSNIVNSTTYSLALTDAGLAIDCTASTAVAITVLAQSTVALPVGTVIEVCQVGAGQVTIVGGSGVTLRTASGLKTRTQWSTLSLRMRAADEWVVSGDATA